MQLSLIRKMLAWAPVLLLLLVHSIRADIYESPLNGLGAHEKFTRGNETYHTPRATFTVQGGKRYRFRVISGAILNCPIQISVDGHTMIMIASDGNPFEPFTADSFNIFAGERYDFVLYADKISPLRNYWIRARGMADCAVKKAHQVALLKYAGAPDVDPPEATDWDSSIRGGILLNPWNTKGTDKQVEITRMRAEVPDGNDGIMTSVPDKKFYLGMDFKKVDNLKFNHPDFYPLAYVERSKHLYSPQVNRISSILPGSPPLSQYDDVPSSQYCNEFTVQSSCTQDWCRCTHKLDVALGDLVELIVVDEGVTFNANHPMHLHGFKFRTVALDKLNVSTSVAEVKAMDERGEITRLTSRAPFKDTVTVPDGGYTIMRFRADNPGVWFFHCHIEYHIDIGMGMIIQVGSKSEFPKVPKNFPRCGSWIPSEDEDDDDDDEDNDDGKQEPILVQCINSPNNAGIRPVGAYGLLVVLVAVCLDACIRIMIR
ncbi:multicopper oxidase [Plakobranchus ocellatus]|uniref:Multicopper oxidase n=1 Tax=Plakobranchus ocellatus TaxID=259542 RepID=A0AAV3ZAJ6_9GAST|nr:multicopper oxidase [Plakobranchus ocellatus]